MISYNYFDIGHLYSEEIGDKPFETTQFKEHLATKWDWNFDEPEKVVLVGDMLT